LEKPTYEQAREWHDSRVTQYLLEEIDLTVSEIKDVWAEGGYTGDSTDETSQLNSRALGNVQALLNLRDFIDSLPVEVTYDEA
jgi:hypothetical protein